jgi:predicted outer membrane protein
MKKGLALLVLLCVACASQTPKSSTAQSAATQPATAEPSAVIVTTDPHAVMGCRMITRTVKGYDIREPEEWRQLQEEAAHRGGNTVLVSLEGDRRGDIFACTKP